MTFTPKNWVDFPGTSTPITAAALEDLETRLSDYTDAELLALAATVATDSELATAIAAEATSRDTAISDAIAALGLGTASTHAASDFDAAGTATSAVAAHEADTTNVHGIADTSALDTVSARNAALAAHEADTTAVHGIADTSVLATATDITNAKARANHTGTQTLSTISDAGTAASKNVAASGDAASGEVVKGNDSRLSDTRTPTDSSVTAAKVAAALKPSGSAATTDESLRALGTTASTAAAGNHTHATLPSSAEKDGLDNAATTPSSSNPFATKTDVSNRMQSGVLASRPAAATFGIGFYYATDDLGGTLYFSDGSAWATAGPRGVELGYAEITSTTPNFSTSETDITGLSITVTVRDRPIIVEFFCGAVNNATSDKYVIAYIKEGTTKLQDGICTPGVAGEFAALYAKARLAPSAGSHTYKISGLSQSGNASFTASAAQPTFIRAAEC